MKLKETDWELEIMYRGRPLSDYRASIIEECAREIEILMAREDIDVVHWPARIRALKDMTSEPYTEPYDPLDYLDSREAFDAMKEHDAAIIEECARVADEMLNHKPTFKFVSDAIRALKDKP